MTTKPTIAEQVSEEFGNSTEVFVTLFELWQTFTPNKNYHVDNDYKDIHFKDGSTIRLDDIEEGFKVLTIAHKIVEENKDDILETLGFLYVGKVVYRMGDYQHQFNKNSGTETFTFSDSSSITLSSTRDKE